MAQAQNPFALFGLEPQFDLDPKALAARYRDLQSVVHPDRFAAASDAERRLALEHAAAVNAAYQTLQDPVRRACSLLALRGIDAMDERNTTMPADFLMQQLQWREALENARTLEHAEHLEAMLDELRPMLGSLGTTFAAALAGEHLETATTLVRKMRFVQKLIEEVEQALGELDTA